MNLSWSPVVGRMATLASVLLLVLQSGVAAAETAPSTPAQDAATTAAVASSPKAGAAPEPPEAMTSPQRRGPHTLAIATGAVGVLFLGVSSGMILNSFEFDGIAADQCDGRDCTAIGENARRRANDRRVLGIGCAVLGAVGIGASLLLWNARERDAPGVRRVSLSQRLGPDQAQLALRAHW